MIKSKLRETLDSCFGKGVELGYWSDAGLGRYVVEKPKHEGQGDFSTNIAMVLAGIEKKKPRDIAVQVVDLIQEAAAGLEKIEIAGPGFINFFIKKEVWQNVLPVVCSQGEQLGRSDFGQNKRVLVEFVSANPTGPLSVGHGRQAVLGDAIARLLEATGHQVDREYYYNDAGRQMRVLAQSVQARYLEQLGRAGEFPEDGYQGEYIIDIAKAMIKDFGDQYAETADLDIFKQRAEQAIFDDINGTLKRLDISFDHYFNEHSLYDDGHVDDVVAKLREKDLVYEQDGAVWFKTTEFGQEKDRVIIKSTGEPTYRLPDIAYHREKFRRGYDWMVDIFGSDHIATVPDVMAGIKALGYDEQKVTVVLHQFVTLLREGKQVKMSTRKATFVTVDELVDEVGTDVVRFFFLLRKADSQLEFDLDLAAEQSQENPVYYVQYAHARICSIIKQAGEAGIELNDPDVLKPGLLVEPEELEILKAMSEFPELIKDAALDLAPHRIVYYLLDLAAQFHSFYNKHRVISEEAQLSLARLWFVNGLRIIIHNGLGLIGVTAPESM